MICTKCNKEIPENTTVCPHCNQEIDMESDKLVNEENIEIESMDKTESDSNENLNNEEEKDLSLEDEDLLDEKVASDTEKDLASEEIKDEPNEVDSNIELIENKKTKDLIKKPIFNKKILLIVGSIVLVIIFAFVGVHYFNESKYNKGIKLLEENNYEEAYTIFSSLNTFNDSSEKAEYAQKGIKYEEAKVLMNNENYLEAIEIFDSITDFKDANELSSRCKSHNYYLNAMDLINSGDYKAALELLYEVDEMHIDDVNNLILECKNTISYLEATELFENGKNYDAYKKFVSLGSFKDSSQKASECIVPKPSTGVLYHNDDYRGSACSLLIKPTSDGSCTYFKIYDGTGEILVATIFINSGASAKINLPAGDYTLKSAYGYKDWFGETDMFGDEGVYQQIKASDTNVVFSLARNYDYTLTLRTLETEGDPVPTKNIDKDSF